jgi:hypothetical protein
VTPSCFLVRFPAISARRGRGDFRCNCHGLGTGGTRWYVHRNIHSWLRLPAPLPPFI